jgi:hypothetical protein
VEQEVLFAAGERATEKGREAFACHDWLAAYDQLALAAADTSADPEAVELLAEARESEGPTPPVPSGAICSCSKPRVRNPKARCRAPSRKRTMRSP